MTIDKLWSTSFKLDRVPLLEVFYCSPLRRCLRTLQLSSSFVCQQSPSPLRIVKEGLRGQLGVRIGDQRSSRLWITRNYPAFAIEEGFSQLDELWRPGVTESFENQTARTLRVLNDIFNEDNSTFISLVTHKEVFATIIGITECENFAVVSGMVYPILVLGEKS